MEKATLVNVLDDAQDIAVIGSLGNDRFVYAAKPSLQAQRRAYDISVSNPADSQVPAYQRYWKFDEKVGIRGSSTWLNLRFDAMALRPSGLWLPGLLEAKALETKGKLKNKVYRDLGIAVYNEKNPNADVAKALLPEAKALKLQTPLIIQYRVLNPFRNDEMTHGIQPSFVETPEGITFGEEAERQLNALNYRANSGVHGLLRYGDGDWDVDWDALGYSGENGRVDWVCGEATRESLEDAHERFLDRKYRKQIRQEQEAFQESLSR